MSFIEPPCLYLSHMVRLIKFLAVFIIFLVTKRGTASPDSLIIKYTNGNIENVKQIKKLPPTFYYIKLDSKYGEFKRLPSFIKNFINLRHLDISGGSGVKNVLVQGFHTVNVGKSPSSLRKLPNWITQFNQLEILDLSFNSNLAFDQEEIDKLKSLKNLKILILKGINFSDQRKNEIKRAMPDCKIVWE